VVVHAARRGELTARPIPHLVAALLAGLATGLVWGILAWATVSDLWHKDGLDYAQIAREVSAGHGLSSRQAIYALHLRFLEQHGLLDAPWPSLHRFPLLCLVMAALFVVLGPGTLAVVLAGILAGAATSAVVYWWARRSIGAVPAVGATVILTLNGALFFGAQAGTPEPLVALLTTLGLYFFWRAATRQDLRSWCWTGLTLGLAILGRTNVATIVPAALVGLAFVASRRRALAGVLCVAGLLAATSPWLVRNTLVAGSPLFSLHSYFLVPSNSTAEQTKRNYSLDWVRDFTPPGAYVRAHPGPVLEKWGRNGLELARAYPVFGGTFLVPLLAWLALARGLGGTLRPVAGVALAGFGLNAVVCNLTDANLEQYYHHLLPALVLLAVAVVWRMVERVGSPAARGLLFTMAVAAMAHPLALVATLSEVTTKSASRIPRAHTDLVSRETAGDAIVFSDQAAVITWDTGRRTIREHFTVQADGRRVLAVPELDDEFGPIDAIYLSSRFVREPEKREMLEALVALPEFTRRFVCRPPLEDGAVLCLRRGPGT
jgi:hypothetical protein